VESDGATVRRDAAQATGKWSETDLEISQTKASVQYIVCAACNLIISYFFNQKRRGKTSVELAESMIKHCIFLQIQPAEVCRGIIEEMMPIFFYIQTKRPDLTPQGLCGIVFQNMNCRTDDQYFEFSVNVDSAYAKPITVSASDLNSGINFMLCRFLSIRGLQGNFVFQFFVQQCLSKAFIL
jgi:hypothetical protein